MEFSRQESWSGLPFPSPEDLPDLGMEPGSPALLVDSLLPESGKLGKPNKYIHIVNNNKIILIPLIILY